MSIGAFNSFAWGVARVCTTPIRHVVLPRRFIATRSESSVQIQREEASRIVAEIFGPTYSNEIRVTDSPKSDKEISDEKAYKRYKKLSSTRELTPEEIEKTFKKLSQVEPGSY